MKCKIPDGLSVYLDMVRLGAAVIVLLTHLWPIVFPLNPLPWPGHSAVVIFFVLSGFVISHAAQPDLGLREYALRRMARIYPVVIAATALSALILYCGIPNIIHYGSPRGSNLQDIGANLLFLGQSWMDLPLPYVGTLWSLDYEVWYYIIFGLWCYYRHPLALMLAAAIAGPKILMLFPVWLLGVFLHRNLIPVGRRWAMSLFVLTTLAGLAFFVTDAGIMLRELLRTFMPGLIEASKGSNQFAGDFILGLIVTINFMAAASLKMHRLVQFKTEIGYLSGFTFSLYVFHLPLAILIWNGMQIHSPAMFFGLLVFGVWLLGMITEQRTKSYLSFLRQIWPRPTEQICVKTTKPFSCPVQVSEYGSAPGEKCPLEPDGSLVTKPAQVD